MKGWPLTFTFLFNACTVASYVDKTKNIEAPPINMQNQPKFNSHIQNNLKQHHNEHHNYTLLITTQNMLFCSL